MCLKQASHAPTPKRKHQLRTGFAYSLHISRCTNKYRNIQIFPTNLKRKDIWFYMRYIIRLSRNNKEKGGQSRPGKNSVQSNEENVDIADHDTEKLDEKIVKMKFCFC